MTEVIIREADSATEGAALRELMARAYQEYHLMPFHRPVESVSDCWLVATVDDDIVGYGVIQVARGQNDADSISEVYVAPEHRRRGIGSLLLRELEKLSTSGFVTAITPVSPVCTDHFFLVACGFESHLPRGMLFEDDMLVHWKIAPELLASWYRERAEVLDRLAAEKKLRSAVDKERYAWEREQVARSIGGGRPRLLMPTTRLPDEKAERFDRHRWEIGGGGRA